MSRQRVDPAGSWKLRISAALALVYVRVMLASRGVRRALGEFGYEAAPSPAVDASGTGDAAVESGVDVRAGRDEVARKTGRLVGETARMLPGTRRCLVQALATALLLRRQGLDHAILIGAAPLAPGFVAHAWVMSCGEIVVGAGALSTLPALFVFRPVARAEGA